MSLACCGVTSRLWQLELARHCATSLRVLCACLMQAVCLFLLSVWLHTFLGLLKLD